MLLELQVPQVQLGLQVLRVQLELPDLLGQQEPQVQPELQV